MDNGAAATPLALVTATLRPPPIATTPAPAMPTDTPSGPTATPTADANATATAIVQASLSGWEQAAAATAVVINTLGMRPLESEPKVFRADHPFLFFIQERKTGEILFMGRVMDPTK